MPKMTAFCFVSESTLCMSAIVANKMVNLIPNPDEIIFVTPDVNKLKLVHKNMLDTNGIPCTYLQDDYVADICGIDKTHLIHGLGWLSRQWIQIHLDKFAPLSEFILTCDSDLVVNRSLNLFDENKINLFIETEYYEPYFVTIKDLFPKLTKFLPKGDSFNSEIMVLIPEQLAKMRQAMSINHDAWIELCYKNTPVNQCPAFSDYETIGTWMINNCPNLINLVKSDTYGDNMRFSGNHKLSNLLKTKSVIPLRLVTDKSIDWDN